MSGNRDEFSAGSGLYRAIFPRYCCVPRQSPVSAKNISLQHARLTRAASPCSKRKALLWPTLELYTYIYIYVYTLVFKSVAIWKIYGTFCFLLLLYMCIYICVCVCVCVCMRACVCVCVCENARFPNVAFRYYYYADLKVWQPPLILKCTPVCIRTYSEHALEKLQRASPSESSHSFFRHQIAKKWGKAKFELIHTSQKHL